MYLVSDDEQFVSDYQDSKASDDGAILLVCDGISNTAGRAISLKLIHPKYMMLLSKQHTKMYHTCKSQSLLINYLAYN